MTQEIILSSCAVWSRYRFHCYKVQQSQVLIWPYCGGVIWKTGIILSSFLCGSVTVCCGSSQIESNEIAGRMWLIVFLRQTAAMEEPVSYLPRGVGALLCHV